jgi:hypothetical protein
MGREKMLRSTVASLIAFGAIGLAAALRLPARLERQPM